MASHSASDLLRSVTAWAVSGRRRALRWAMNAAALCGETEGGNPLRMEGAGALDTSLEVSLISEF
jgi:hypothetical protein